MGTESSILDRVGLRRQDGDGDSGKSLRERQEEVCGQRERLRADRGLKQPGTGKNRAAQCLAQSAGFGALNATTCSYESMFPVGKVRVERQLAQETAGEPQARPLASPRQCLSWFLRLHHL